MGLIAVWKTHVGFRCVASLGIIFDRPARQRYFNSHNLHPAGILSLLAFSLSPEAPAQSPSTNSVQLIM